MALALQNPCSCKIFLISLKVVELLEKVKFVFVPFVNPDGYEVSMLTVVSLLLADASTLGPMIVCGERINASTLALVASVWISIATTLTIGLR